MFELNNAIARDVQSLQNWLNGNSCLSWEESEYLNHKEDLLAVSHTEDDAAKRLEIWVENGIAQCRRRFGKAREVTDIYVLLCKCLLS
jgi:hypothetical protein